MLAVQDPEVREVNVRAITWTRAKLPAFRPTPLRVVFCPRRHIHAAIDCPVDRVSENRALGRGAAKARNQKSRLPGETLGRKLRKREIKHRHITDAKTAAIHLGIAPGLHHNLVRIEGPFGTRQLASGHGTVMHNEMVATRLYHQLSHKREWRSGRTKHYYSQDLKPD